MNLSLPIELAQKYKSPSQIARVVVEPWVERELACPNCGHFPLQPYPNNYHSADFTCIKCKEDFQVKGTKDRIGKKLQGAKYNVTLENVGKINFIILRYDPKSWVVQDVIIIPKYFITPGCIIPRNPLSKDAQRSGWQGCNIIIPDTGKIFWIKSKVIQSFQTIRMQWNHKIKLVENKTFESRVWIMDIILCIEKLKKKDFSLQEMYKFEPELRMKFPDNNHIKDKIRQQLQILRDKGYLEFLEKGQYQLK